MMVSFKKKSDILNKAFRETFHTKLLKGLGFTSLFGLAGIVNLIWKMIDSNLLDYVFYGLYTLLLFFVLRFMYYLIKYSFIYIYALYMDSQWGNMLKIMKAHQNSINSILRQDYDESEIKKVIVTILNEQSRWLSHFLSSDSSMSIKVPKNMSDGLNSWELNNLFRDSNHDSRDTDRYRNIKHTIIHNTPFSRVIAHITSNDPKHISYINEDIPKSNNYENTSIQVYPDQMLPYQSEIVSPIMLYKLNDAQKCNGFLCMDCSDANRFGIQREYLCAINEMLAEMIYPVIELIHLKQNSNG